MGAGVLIPFLVGRTVDRVRHGRTDLWPLVGALLAAGALRLAFSVARRLVAGRVSLGVEYDLRNRMYAHLQSLEVAFFDEQQTGQLMSRATVDLQAVRFFLGYGLIFFFQHILTLLGVTAVMFWYEWRVPRLAPAPARRAAADGGRRDRGGGEHRRRPRREVLRAGATGAGEVRAAVGG